LSHPRTTHVAVILIIGTALTVAITTVTITTGITNIGTEAITITITSAIVRTNFPAAITVAVRRPFSGRITNAVTAIAAVFYATGSCFPAIANAITATYFGTSLTNSIGKSIRNFAAIS
jgi:hypothetical protein